MTTTDSDDGGDDDDEDGDAHDQQCSGGGRYDDDDGGSRFASISYDGYDSTTTSLVSDVGLPISILTMATIRKPRRKIFDRLQLPVPISYSYSIRSRMSPNVMTN